MNFALDHDQEQLRDSARRLSLRELLPLLQGGRRLSRERLLLALAKLGGLGLTSARVPEAAGGAGMKMLDYGIMLEQIPPAIALSLIAHEASVARLHAEGNDEQRARLLPDLIAGRKIFCTGSTEPDAGSDPRAIRTRLSRKGSRLVLNGRKIWITNAHECDLMLVTCLDTRAEADAGKLAKVVVSRGAPGFETRSVDTIGLRQGVLGEALFEDCEVEERNVILSAGGATDVLKRSWAVNRPLLGLMGVHLAQRAFDIAVDYARSRKQFGKPIGSHQLIQKSLSDIETAVVASRLMCYHALSAADHGAGGEGVAAMAKRHAQNACQEAVWQAMNVLGAMGLAAEGEIEGLYRDVRMIAVPDGTNEILALLHGREITGLDAFRGTQ